MYKIRRGFVMGIIGLLIIFTLAGCSSTGKAVNSNSQGDVSQKTEDKPQVNPGGGDAPNAQTGKNVDQNALKQWEGVKGRIITDHYPAEITKYLEENKTKETQRAFNINNKTYLVMTMGQQPSAGYQIELKNLALKDGTLRVSVKYEKPLKNDIVATVITYPSLIIETDDIYEGHYEIKYDIEK
ncbi:MAG: protease complex subunit PrcB family protein [Peptococcaceae bacterium]|nr:protease complex subunit PrcB family protein [Peptococcaceae bacterium]